MALKVRYQAHGQLGRFIRLAGYGRLLQYAHHRLTLRAQAATQMTPGALKSCSATASVCTRFWAAGFSARYIKVRRPIVKPEVCACLDAWRSLTQG